MTKHSSILRLIPKVEIKNDNIVKGINFEGLRAFGNPEAYIESYYLKGADEIAVIDVAASLYNLKPKYDLIKHITKNKFIPFTYGGNLNSLNNIERILNCGIDKVYLNSSVVKDINFLKDSIKYFGASTIVLGIETQVYMNKQYVFSKFGREFHNLELDKWINRCVDIGIGEIMISSISHDGMQNGLDINLLSNISKRINVPIIASGGFSDFEDIKLLKQKTECTGLCISSSLHYYEREKQNNIIFSNIGNYSYHRKTLNYANNNYKKINLQDLVNLRDELYEQ